MPNDRDFIAVTDGECKTVPELVGRRDLRVARHLFRHTAHPAAPEPSAAAPHSLMKRGTSTFYRRSHPFPNIPLVDEPGHPDKESPTASATLMPSIPADRMPPA